MFPTFIAFENFPFDAVSWFLVFLIFLIFSSYYFLLTINSKMSFFKYNSPEWTLQWWLFKFSWRVYCFPQILHSKFNFFWSFSAFYIWWIFPVSFWVLQLSHRQHLCHFHVPDNTVEKFWNQISKFCNRKRRILVNDYTLFSDSALSVDASSLSEMLNKSLEEFLVKKEIKIFF